MTKLFSLVLFCSLGFGTFAAAEKLVKPMTRKPNSKCGSKQAVMYRPGGSDLMEAANSFNVELELISDNCTVQDKMKITSQQYIFLTSYTREQNTEKLSYLVHDFSNRTQKNCSITAESRLAKQNCDVVPCPLMGVMELIVSDPTCTKPRPLDE